MNYDRNLDGGLGVGLAMASDGSVEFGKYEQATPLIREAILQAGAGRFNCNAPLTSIIEPGMSVLLKPNWVSERNHGGHGMECMVTHPEFILAVLKEAVAAKPGRILIGDAPIQGCRWEQVVSENFRRRMIEISAPMALNIIDFRRTILRGDNLLNGVHLNARDIGRFVLFDLGSDSLLEPVSRPEGRFRVTQYDPRELAKRHAPGVHQYLLCREAFEADVILNLPKLKTHRKAGLTGALKNLVGLNGNKDYLPHHRVGGTTCGGDCYGGLAPLKRAAEYCLDRANQRIGSPAYKAWIQRAWKFLDWQRRFGDVEIEGGWYGNDTVWRMALDLNRILLYGKSDGSMADEPQRRIWSLTDAIVCGEGEGPLSPEPLWLGGVTFSDSPISADAVHAALFHLETEKIPLLREAFGSFRWPIAQERQAKVKVHYKDSTLNLEEVAIRLGVNARPSRGWLGHCEMETARP